MTEWTKNGIIELLRQHPSQLMLIEAKNSRLKIQGRIREVVDLDLCSLILQETLLHLETEGIQIVLTFHDDFLGIHCTIQSSEESESEVFLPCEIPYPVLKLTLVR